MNYYVLSWDFNSKNVVPYDIFQYLKREYEDKKIKPKSFKEFKEFILCKSLYMWWSRCEYEILVGQFPPTDHRIKLDIHYQVKMNIDNITKLFMEEVTNETD